MTALQQLEMDSVIEESDILVISGIIMKLIDVKSTVKTQQTINARENLLDSLAGMLEKMLTNNLHLSRQDKVSIVHSLDKLRAQKEYMQFLKEVKKNGKQTISDIQIASGRLSKKSQSAFELDE